MAFTIHHTRVPAQQPGMTRPYWYQLESSQDSTAAARRAYNYALDHGGYVCVKDAAGKVIFGSDPVELDRAITIGINRDFSETSARVA